MMVWAVQNSGQLSQAGDQLFTSLPWLIHTFPTALFKTVGSGFYRVTFFLDGLAEALGVLSRVHFNALCLAIHFNLCLFIYPFEGFVDRVLAMLTGHPRHFKDMFHLNAPKIGRVGAIVTRFPQQPSNTDHEPAKRRIN
jgi:hypothetical protein